MSSMTGRDNERPLWRSLDELAESPDFRHFVESEFPSMKEQFNGPSRRQFLKLMGASLALAGAAGCRWPVDKLAPYANRPMGRTPGIPVDFATSMEVGGVGTGLLAKSFDGRPIKVEGNTLHSNSLGGTSAIQQAAILELYDPDRSQFPVHRTASGRQNAEWSAFQRWAREHFAALRGTRGSGLAVLSEATSSATIADMRKRFAKEFPEAQWFEYEPLSRDNEREGTRLAFGAPYRTHIDFAKADVIVSLDDDFIGDHPAAVGYMRKFAARRTASDGTMNRLYQIEATMSLTGSNADHRYAEKSTLIGARLCQLAKALAEHGLELPGAAKTAVEGVAGAAPGYIAEIAGDLLAHRGHAVITVGPRQSAEVHALAALLNRALGNAGQAVQYSKEIDADRPTHAAAISDLAGKLGAGAITTLVILGGNPAYNAPADLQLAEKIAKAEHSVHLGLFNDETARQCEWHVPRPHWLESWGDARGWDGTIAMQQPLIDPIFCGKNPEDRPPSVAELMAMMSGDTLTTGFELTKRVYDTLFAPSADVEKAWRKALCDGVLPDTAAALEAPMPTQSDWAGVIGRIPTDGPSGDSFEFIFAADKLHDGRFANNAWLQELPHPITKLTWDNAAMISPADASRWGIRQDRNIEVTIGDRKLTLPVFVMPGHAPGSITLPLGYGRVDGGAVAADSGKDCNTYMLRTSDGMNVAKGSVRVLGTSQALATTQDHHAMHSDVGVAETQKRIPHLVREGTLGQFKRDPKSVARVGNHPLPLLNEKGEPPQPFGDHDFADKPAWAMAIDLAKCTGCSACVTACQAENNVPVVGRDEVARGREMHWIRVDRYFKGEPESDDVEVLHQPVACVHCENAPCEQVCPVAATTHDEEGLNVMVYNRCIGTRYCLNNCPYKVRRFNWFYNQHGPSHPRNKDGWFQTKLTELEKLGKNPEVTVRTRGVMEKCTYCVQRISAVKIPARNDNREILDLEIMTACQQACPAEAITFGDLRKATSSVSLKHKDDRSYFMLEDLNVRPRTKYLAGLRNPLHETEGPSGGGEHGHV